jgi:glycosyltransferase involved in cell wall biosynthesis
MGPAMGDQMQRSGSTAGTGNTETPRISVVIPHLNQPEMLLRCLASLAAGQRRADEIIVVDNGSVTLPTEACAAWPDVQILQEPTPGPGPARNKGIAAATGDILAFIDADCIAAPDWLAAAGVAMADPEATILGGDVRIAYADPDRLTMLEAYESIYAYRMDRYIAREGFTGTGNLVVRRVVLTDVGPFAGIGIAEDRDWGRRATAKGYRIRYVAGMKVYHPARKDFEELRRKWRRQTAHDFADALVAPFGRVKWAIKMLAMGLSPLGELPRVLLSDRLKGLRNRALALLCLARIRSYRAGLMFWLLFGGNPDQLSGQWNRA